MTTPAPLTMYGPTGVDPPRMHTYGWAQLSDDGTRDPSAEELAYLQSIQRWTTQPNPPEPEQPRTTFGEPQFQYGPDGQPTSEFGLFMRQPLLPYVISEGNLSIASLYGAGGSPTSYEPTFHAANPHLASVHPYAIIPRGVRVHVPHGWAPRLHGHGYRVFTRSAPTGLGDSTSVAGTLATLQGTQSTPVTADADGSFTSAVTSRQAAGNTGATVLGPDIDATWGIANTGPNTQSAYALNAQLAAVNASASTQDDANQAYSLLGQMIAAYQNAIAAGQLATPPAAAAPTPASAPAPAATVPPAAAAAHAAAVKGATAAVAKSTPTPSTITTTTSTTTTAPVLCGDGSPAPGGDKTKCPPAAKKPQVPTGLVVGGVVGGAALLGVLLAVAAKKKRRAPSAPVVAATNPLFRSLVWRNTGDWPRSRHDNEIAVLPDGSYYLLESDGEGVEWYLRHYPPGTSRRTPAGRRTIAGTPFSSIVAAKRAAANDAASTAKFNPRRNKSDATKLFDFSDLSGDSTPSSLAEFLDVNEESPPDPSEVRALRAARVGDVVHLGIGGGHVTVRRVR